MAAKQTIKKQQTATSSDQVVTDIVKQKRNRPDLANFGQENIQPGDNTKYISFALDTFEAPPIDLSDEKQVEDRIMWYLRRCMEYDMKPGVVGLANALHVSRQTLWAWKNGVRRGDETAHVDLIKRAYGFLEELWEDYMLNGKVSPPNGIFLGKNHFDYKDVQDVVITPNNPLDTADPNTARQKYIEALPDTTDQD